MLTSGQFPPTNDAPPARGWARKSIGLPYLVAGACRAGHSLPEPVPAAQVMLPAGPPGHAVKWKWRKSHVMQSGVAVAAIFR